jgi:hypothetical protein
VARIDRHGQVHATGSLPLKADLPADFYCSTLTFLQSVSMGRDVSTAHSLMELS